MNTAVNDSNQLAKEATQNHPFSGSDEFRDDRLPSDAVVPTLGHSTYIDVNDEDFRKKASFKEIRKLSYLELYNRGTHNGKWTRDRSAKHNRDDWSFCNALTGQMGLPEYQQKLTWRLFKNFDMRSYRGYEPNTNKETAKQYLVVFCIGALIYNHFQPDKRWQYYPGKNYKCKSERYLHPKYRLEAEGKDEGDRHRTIERVGYELGFEDDEIVACLEKVRPVLPKWLRQN